MEITPCFPLADRKDANVVRSNGRFPLKSQAAGKSHEKLHVGIFSANAEIAC